MTEDTWCTCCGEREGKLHANGDYLCEECGYTIGAPSQQELDAALGAAVRNRMKTHCFTPSSLRSMAGDLSNSGWDGASAFLRAIAAALSAEAVADAKEATDE